MPASRTADSPPRAPPIGYVAHNGTRWEKEKASAESGAFEYPDDAQYVGPWVIGECVGKGASGHVKIAKHRTTGQLAAVKVLPLDFVFGSGISISTRAAKTDKQRLGIDREITMMKLMNHPNILRIYDVYEGDKELYLVLEYVKGGELFDFLVNKGRMQPLEALAFFKQIIYGLSYAHAFSVIHRDLKPENILLASVSPPIIKIADWGMATFAPPELELETSCGSPHYASPEIVHGHKYEGTATDIWSCGVILFALLTGRLPFDDKDVRVLLGKVKRGKYDIPPYVDPLARDLVTRMLVVDVHRRITIPEILTHPWFAIETPGILYLPAPPVEELARPVASARHINPDVFESLCVIWSQAADPEEVKAELLSPPGEGMLAKAFYFLLHRHRELALQEYGILNDLEDSNFSSPGLRPKTITRVHMSPLTKKNRPLSLDSAAMPAPRSLMAQALDRGQTAPARLFPRDLPPLTPTTPTSASRRSRPITPVGPRPRPVSSPTGTPTSTPTGATLVVPEPASPIRSPPRAHDPRTPRRSPVDLVSAPAHRTSFAPRATPGVISPPRVADPSVQRTIDDLANRMNKLVRNHTSPVPETTHSVPMGKENTGARPKEDRNGLGLGRALAKDMGNYGSDRITRSVTKERERKARTAPTELASPAPISTARSALLHSPRGEVKGWFSNLFHWKAHAYGLQAPLPPAAARAEIQRVLLRVNLDVAISGAPGEPLQCAIRDAYDPRTGMLLVKAVRFRVECVGIPGGGSELVLVQEKGAMSTLRLVYQRVREEWRVSGADFEMVEREDAMDVAA